MKTAKELVEDGWYRPCGGTTSDRLGFIEAEVAAEIERLTAENERLRATLKDIQAKSVSFRPPRFTWFYDRAEEALNQQLSVKDQSNGG